MRAWTLLAWTFPTETMRLDVCTTTQKACSRTSYLLLKAEIASDNFQDCLDFFDRATQRQWNVSERHHPVLLLAFFERRYWTRKQKQEQEAYIPSLTSSRTHEACKQRPDKPIAILLDTKAGRLGVLVRWSVTPPSHGLSLAHRSSMTKRRNLKLQTWSRNVGLCLIMQFPILMVVVLCYFNVRALRSEQASSRTEPTVFKFSFWFGFRQSCTSTFDKLRRRNLQVGKSTWKMVKSSSLWQTTVSRQGRGCLWHKDMCCLTL